MFEMLSSLNTDKTRNDVEVTGCISFHGGSKNNIFKKKTLLE